jgi:hypothetical protein
VLPNFNDIELTHDAKLLGNVLTDSLSFEKYVTAFLTCCSQRFYLIKLLRDGDMSVNNLDFVFSSLIVNRITYCMQIYFGLAF